ncbi:MAG: hypothetical protein J6X44_04640 [Thermoguttaceae bacterium]|nr:hypothetical protein [Thermoguttaceae bacterium]
MYRDHVVKRRASRLDGKACRKSVVACCSAALVLFSVAFVLDLAYWNARLSLESARRANARFSTSDGAVLPRDLSSTAILDRSDNQARLFAAADDYRRTRGFDAASSDAVDAGLARWGLSDSAAALDVARLRDEDNLASRAAIDALESFEHDSDIDAALAFLNELDGELTELAESDSDYELWAFAGASGNPIDSVGIVSERDFTASPQIQEARNIADASARVFLLATLGVFLLAPRTRLCSVLELLRAFWTSLIRRSLDFPLSARVRRLPASRSFYASTAALRGVRLLI